MLLRMQHLQKHIAFKQTRNCAYNETVRRFQPMENVKKQSPIHPVKDVDASARGALVCENYSCMDMREFYLNYKHKNTQTHLSVWREQQTLRMHLQVLAVKADELKSKIGLK